MAGFREVSLLYGISEFKGTRRILQDIADSISRNYGKYVSITVSPCHKFITKEIKVGIKEKSPRTDFEDILRKYLSYSEFIGDGPGVDRASDYSIVMNAIPEGKKLKRYWKYLLFSDGRRHIVNTYDR
jgi:hypothetical protein